MKNSYNPIVTITGEQNIRFIDKVKVVWINLWLPRGIEIKYEKNSKPNQEEEL